MKTKGTLLIASITMLYTILAFGCDNTKKNNKPDTEATKPKERVCEMCGNTIEGLGWFDDSETGWRPAKESDWGYESTPICSKVCGKRYNRKDGDKPDNWSTKH